MEKSRILIVAPHCDDEILGCGGIISKRVKQGREVFIAIVTNGNIGAPELFSEKGTQQVRSEALEAHKLLGVHKTFFLDFPAPRLDSIPSYKLSLKINELINQEQVDELYLPHRGDIHKDHRIVFEAGLVAARPINNCTVKSIYTYETLSETEWAPPFGDDAFIPNYFEDISAQIEDKIAAFSLYTSQLKKFPHPRSNESIYNLSQYRGACVGFTHAEAFMLIRSISH